MVSTATEKQPAYPGKSATFVLHESDWSLSTEATPANVVRSMDFKSTTPDSFLSEVTIRGYRNWDINFSVEVPKSYRKAADVYFQKMLRIFIDTGR